MNRWDKGAIEYTNVEALRATLVGRSIVSTLSEGSDYDRVLTFVLDNGALLKAHANHGGCACSNGCFTVEPGNVVRGTITNVAIREVVEDFDWNTSKYRKREVEPGSIGDGSAVINVFVYADLGEQLLLSSEGGDNGYYGWGFWLSVHEPEPASSSAAPGGDHA